MGKTSSLARSEARAVKQYALSLKQPWAALLVAGRKTIEVRRWPTAFRGRVLIHAARVPDDRPEARAHVSPELSETARLGGGIIGAGTLVDCRPYATVEAFSADQSAHLNDPSWFEPPVLYGFVFADLEPLAFRRYPGWVRIFEVKDDLPRRRPRREAKGHGRGGSR
jgi:hypothetical protein